MFLIWGKMDTNVQYYTLGTAIPKLNHKPQHKSWKEKFYSLENKMKITRPPTYGSGLLETNAKLLLNVITEGTRKQMVRKANRTNPARSNLAGSRVKGAFSVLRVCVGTAIKMV